jgi:hypothetical protein
MLALAKASTGNVNDHQVGVNDSDTNDGASDANSTAMIIAE